MSTTYVPTFKPTSKRRSFRPSSFRPLEHVAPPTLATLSESLRASLMNVGMRVRKSVPEGYKTTSCKPGFDIYEQTAAAHPELATSTYINTSSSPSSLLRRTGLLPPVQLTHGGGGGLRADMVADENAMSDEQVAATVDDVLLGLDADLAGWSGGDGEALLSSSQESIVSASSGASPARGPAARFSASARRKRMLRAEEEEDDEFNIWGGAGGSVPMERDAPLRTIAQPRSRRPQLRRNGSSVSSGKGSRKSVRFAMDLDFGEADFLMPDIV